MVLTPDFDIIKMVADKLATLGGARYRDASGRSLINYTTQEQAFEEWKLVSANRALRYERA